MTICPACTTSPGSAPVADDDPSGIHLQFGVAHPILGGLQLRFGGIELGPRGLQRLLGLLELRARGDVSGEQRPLTLEVALAPRFELRLGRRNARLRGAQGIELVLRLELGHDLSGLDVIADIDGAFDHPSGDAKGQTCFVFRLDTAGIGDGLADLALHHGHRPHRTNLRRGGVGLRLAGRQQSQGEPGQQESRSGPRSAEHAACG